MYLCICVLEFVYDKFVLSDQFVKALRVKLSPHLLYLYLRIVYLCTTMTMTMMSSPDKYQSLLPAAVSASSPKSPGHERDDYYNNDDDDDNDNDNNDDDENDDNDTDDDDNDNHDDNDDDDPPGGS